jgi:hypothetical protein
MSESLKSEQSPRDLLARADAERHTARWADDMLGTLRLGRPVTLSEMHQRGPFGRKRKYHYVLDDRMPGQAVAALYRALRLVRDEANTNADALEAQVTTRGKRPGESQ